MRDEREGRRERYEVRGVCVGEERLGVDTDECDGEDGWVGWGVGRGGGKREQIWGGPAS